LTLNQLVLGSSPSAPTNEFKHLGQFPRTGLFAFARLGTNWVRMQNVGLRLALVLLRQQDQARAM